jgi:hypothetical protein
MFPALQQGCPKEAVPMGFTMKENHAATQQYETHYQKATEWEKRALLSEFTRPVHQKSLLTLI